MRAVKILGALAVVGLLAWWLLAPSSAPVASESSPKAVAPVKPDGPRPMNAGLQRIMEQQDQASADRGFPDLGVGAAATAAEDARADAGRPRPAALSPVDASAVHKHFARNAELAEKMVDRFCEASGKVKQAGLGPPKDAKPSRDAAAYLSVRVDWENAQRPHGLLHLPEPLRQRLKAYGTDWPVKVTEADLAGVDFGWLDDLAQFDHWTLLGDGPARDAKEPTFSTAPIPNLIGFQEWVKLRFAASLRKGDIGAASLQVRQLVFLLHTTGMLIAEAVAVVLLKLEAAAFDVAKAKGLDVGPRQPYAREDLDQYRRTSFGAAALLFPGVKPEVAKKALGCAANPCMAIYEATGLHAELGQYAPTNTTSEFTAMADAAGCDPKQLEWLRRVKPVDFAEAARNLTGAYSLDRFTGDAGF